ncbi:hypothetical protein FQN50_004980 [Emmonsiellopsis sp. PD_5]|nr:hypothetical protein FQN50_004980 [Emmonsiellopsis sp. PD_5]
MEYIIFITLRSQLTPISPLPDTIPSTGVSTMENQPPPANPPANPSTPAQQSLIRTDQVQKLPHLNDAQKLAHTQAVRTLWDTLNAHPQNSPEYQTAQHKLNGISQNLMKGMRLFQTNRQNLQIHQQQKQMQMQQQQQMNQSLTQAQNQAQQPQGAAAQPNTAQRPAGGQAQTFTQLLPQIQAKANSLNILHPPKLEGTPAENWVNEARLRYGFALQKQEVGKLKLDGLRNAYNQRSSSGSLSPEELQEFRNRQTSAQKLMNEGSDFLAKFKEQQEQLRAQHQQLQQQQQQQGQHPQQSQQPSTQQQQQPQANLQNRPGQLPQQQPGQAVKPDIAMPDAPRPPTQISTSAPAPHTITSAVAARNQAGQNMSPAPQQAGQTPSQTPTQTTLPQPPQPQQPQAVPQNAPMQPFIPQTSQPESAGTPVSAAPSQPAQSQPQGPPRPLSHAAAMAQAAQSYSNNTNPNQQQMTQQPPNAHAHPQGTPGYANNRPENSSRTVHMAIPKNLNVKPPEPVSMGPARPTLSGGPSHGAMGMMGQPAIQKHPGYVLEGEGQHVLSKKMLDVLVKQVTGGGEGEGLTPDAEEFILQMADDFVDDVITAACRLAKLRPASTLDIRDIQLVLERNYNMRIPGFSSDDLRTVKKPHPTQGWTQKMSAIQAAKVTQGRSE